MTEEKDKLFSQSFIQNQTFGTFDKIHTFSFSQNVFFGYATQIFIYKDGKEQREHMPL